MEKQKAIDILWAEIGNNQQPLYCTRKELCDAVNMAEEAICRVDPANEPLTLDELREHNRKPIWVVILDASEPARWEICRYNMYDLTLYGKTWLAYRRKLVAK